MSRFKTGFAVFFLLIFTFNVIIYYSLFEFSEFEAKAEMSQVISGMRTLQETQIVKLPISRLDDVRHDEIWLEGRLFDIVKTEVKADSVIVYVLNDTREQNLVAGMKMHEDESADKISTHAPGKPASKHGTQTPVQKYLPGAAVISFRYHAAGKMLSCEINCVYSTPVPVVLAPPPEPLS